MPLFGGLHAIMLVLTAVLCVLCVWVARRIRETQAQFSVTRTAGWALLVLSLGWMGWGMLPANWTIEQSLPVHFSDVLRIVTAIALIRRSRWTLAISFYWGLTLNLQSLLTPNLTYYDYPGLEFALYWVLHIAVFVVPLVFAWGLGYRPGWRDFSIAYAAAVLWAAVASLVNVTLDTNYAFLSERPPGPSVLDLLGPWPVYIFWEAVVIALVWALMTWPWRGPAQPAAGAGRDPSPADQ